MNHEDTSSSHGFSWDEAKLGPTPEAMERYMELGFGHDGCADAAFEALVNTLAKSIEWGRIEQKRKQEAEEREHNAIVRAEQAERNLESLHIRFAAIFEQRNETEVKLAKAPTWPTVEALQKHLRQAEAERDERRAKLVARLLDANLKQAEAPSSAERALIAQREEVARLSKVVKEQEQLVRTLHGDVLSLETELADLNRVLAAGREEYELAVAEMNRRGEEVARLEQFPDEVVKALENARIAPPTLSGSEEYNEGVARCVEIAADLAARYEERRQP